MRPFLVRVLFIAGCTLLSLPISSFAVSRENALSYAPHRVTLCRQFNNVEIVGDGFSSYDRDTPDGVAAVFEEALMKLGCMVYHGKGERNGIITVGIERVVRDHLLGPGPPEERDTFHFYFLWSKGTDNTEARLHCSSVADGSADSDRAAIGGSAPQLLQALENAIRANERRKQKVSRRWQ